MAGLLARRFQQNWMNRYPQDACHFGPNSDDSLTSLAWLQNLRVSEFTQPKPASNHSVVLDGNSRNFIKQGSHTSTQFHATPQAMKLEPLFLTEGMTPVFSGTSNSQMEHKQSHYAKPPYSYASLICMAIKANRKSKITLASIYNWITENFEYYRLSDPSWQNSIRHNLSLNKCFEKVPRRKDEPGKGGFWRINPEYCELTENGIVKKRRGVGDSTPSPPLKRFKSDHGDTHEISNLKTRMKDDRFLSTNSSSLSTSDDDDDDDENSLTLKGDLNWTTILKQDINIGGRTVKTEDIIDESESLIFATMSPHCSESSSEDMGLDFLTQTSLGMALSTDFQNNDPLDLTVQGTTIRKPDWWATEENNNEVNINSNTNSRSGLNTPEPTSPESETENIIWGEGLRLGSSGNTFDLDSLFSFENIPSPGS